MLFRGWSSRKCKLFATLFHHLNSVPSPATSFFSYSVSGQKLVPLFNFPVSLLSSFSCLVVEIRILSLLHRHPVNQRVADSCQATRITNNYYDLLLLPRIIIMPRHKSSEVVRKEKLSSSSSSSSSCSVRFAAMVAARFRSIITPRVHSCSATVSSFCSMNNSATPDSLSSSLAYSVPRSISRC